MYVLHRTRIIKGSLSGLYEQKGMLTARKNLFQSSYRHVATVLGSYPLNKYLYSGCWSATTLVQSVLNVLKCLLT